MSCKRTECGVWVHKHSFVHPHKAIVIWTCQQLALRCMCENTITLHNILTGSVNIVRRCEANASTARELKAAPFSSEYQKFLLGSSITKFTTNSAYSTRNQVMVAHTIPQLSWMNHSVRFPAVWPAWGPPTITPAARLPVSTSGPADSSGWCCSISRSRWFEDCILP